MPPSPSGFCTMESRPISAALWIVLSVHWQGHHVLVPVMMLTFLGGQAVIAKKMECDPHGHGDASMAFSFCVCLLGDSLEAGVYLRPARMPSARSCFAVETASGDSIIPTRPLHFCSRAGNSDIERPKMIYFFKVHPSRIVDKLSLQHPPFPSCQVHTT